MGYDPKAPTSSVGERIAARRRQLGLTQREVAALFGWDEGTLRRYERGEWTPSEGRLAQLLRWLGPQAR